MKQRRRKKKGKTVKRKEKRKNPQQEKAHRREAASGAHLHPWDGWRVGPGGPAALRFPSRRGQ